MTTPGKKIQARTAGALRVEHVLCDPLENGLGHFHEIFSSRSNKLRAFFRGGDVTLDKDVVALNEDC